MRDNVTQFLIEKLLKAHYNISPEDILAIYPYGSVVYGTDSEQSDRDYVAIIDMVDDYHQFESDKIDIHIISISHFKTLLNRHDIMALETYFNNSPIKDDLQVDFELNLPALRKSISSIVSNSWVKANKKLTLENEDNYTGIKSGFHAIRIARMGSLIASGSNDIFPSSNKDLWKNMYEDAINCNYDWKSLNAIYKPIINKAMSEFRLVAPKE